MNHINAIITDIKTSENISIVTFEADGHLLKMMALGLARTMQVGSKVILGVKASNIILAKDLSGDCSISNRFHVKIEKINYGELLCAVFFRFDKQLLESIITRECAENMNLHVSDTITALIQSSELSIIEVKA